jgi:hypothetical protein
VNDLIEAKSSATGSNFAVGPHLADPEVAFATALQAILAGFESPTSLTPASHHAG